MEEEEKLRRGSISGRSGTRNFTLLGVMHSSAADKSNCRRLSDALPLPRYSLEQQVPYICGERRAGVFRTQCQG